MPSTVKKIPFTSLEVIWLRTVTLGTFGLGGAAVDATHEGGFGFFFGRIASLRSVAKYSVLWTSTYRFILPELK